MMMISAVNTQIILRKVINCSLVKNDWTEFEKNNPAITLNVL